MSEDDFDRARVYNNIANCYMDLRDWEESERYLLRSLDKKVSGGDTAGQATTYANLAKLYFARGDQPRGIAAAQKAVELFADLSNWYELGQAQRTLACIHGDGPAAQTALQAAIDAFTRAKAERERSDAQAQLERISKSRATPRRRIAGAVAVLVVLLVLSVLVSVCYALSG